MKIVELFEDANKSKPIVYVDMDGVLALPRVAGPLARVDDPARQHPAPLEVAHEQGHVVEPLGERRERRVAGPPARPRATLAGQARCNAGARRATSRSAGARTIRTGCAYAGRGSPSD